MAVHAESNIQLNTIPAQTSLLGGHFVYFQGNTGSGGNTPASANVIADSRYLSIPAQWGYNTHIGANGIKLRYNEITLSEWTANHLTFYKPGTNNPSLELISGINTALNIYNPTNNTKTLGLDINGLNFYGTSISAPDVTLNANGLTLINGSIRGGIVGQDEFLYLSPQVFVDEYEEYVLSEDTEVDETKVYYIRSGEEGEYIYTEVSEPTGNPQENEYYEIAHAPGTIPIDNYVKDNWRQIIGTKFAVDTEGNLYANNAHLNNAEVEGAITATSLTIGSGSNVYDGEAAINISGYDIVIYEDSTDESIIDHDNTTYLYPVMYHNGEIDETVNNTHYIWYVDDGNIGTIGDAVKGGIIASYGHNYRVTYDFDDGAVGSGTAVQDRLVDPSKYITKISDTGITIHPEDTSNNNYIQLDGTALTIVKNGITIATYGSTITIGANSASRVIIDTNGLTIFKGVDDVAQFGTTARIGKDNNSRFLINSSSLQGYDSSNVKYFEVSANELSWGDNIAATTSQVTSAAQTATNYIKIDGNGIKVQNSTDATDYLFIDSSKIALYRNNVEKMQLTDSLLRLGDISNYINLNSSGMDIFTNSIQVASFTDDGIIIGVTPPESGLNDSDKRWAVIDDLGFIIKEKGTFIYDTIESVGGFQRSTSDSYAQYIGKPYDSAWSVYLIYPPITGTPIKIYSEDIAHSSSFTFTAGTASEAGAFDTIHYDGDRTITNSTYTGGGSEPIGYITDPDTGELVPLYPAGGQVVSTGQATYLTYQTAEVDSGDYIFVGRHDDHFQHGKSSALFGENLIGQHEYQVIIGKYNKNDSEDVLEIGNGTDYDDRSNALAINWRGCIKNTHAAYSSWIDGRTYARIQLHPSVGATTQMHPYISMKSYNGAWQISTYQSDLLYFMYTTDTNFNAHTNSATGAYINTNGTYSTTSDRKVKENIVELTYGKDLIMGLKPVEYSFINSSGNRRHMGFIAQDVAQIGKDLNKNLSLYSAYYLPESNHTNLYYGEDVDDKELTWTLSYSELIAPLVQTVQEQQAEIDELKEKVQKYEQYIYNSSF